MQSAGPEINDNTYMKKNETPVETVSTEETPKAKRATRTRKKAETKPAEEVPAAATTAEPSKETPVRKRAARKTAKKQDKPQTAVQEAPQAVEPEVNENKKAETPEAKAAEQKVETPQAAPAKQKQNKKPQPKPVTIPSMVNVQVRDFCDLVNQSNRIPILNDQQIQMLSWEEAVRRSEMMEDILCAVLDYDIVLSDTNIWLELLVGHSSSHSDPRVNARLQFERQLESISKMMKRIGGRFMVMSETYEEIDRFATALEPVNYKDADWTDEALCRNVAARLAKRLMLAQQKENRLRIEGIGSESHHAAFADPAIIRRTVELFALGKKVLLLTNDASVGIRSLGMCDDLQRVNDIDDDTWHDVYEPQRPMVLTMDDLKTLDTYTRQYHNLSVAAGRQWMQGARRRETVTLDQPLKLWLDGFRPGDRHERRSDRVEQQRKEQDRKEQQRKEQQRKEQQRRDQELAEARRKAEQEAAEQKAAEAIAEAQTAAIATPATNTEPATQAGTDEATPTVAPEEKKARTRRSGRGRRGGKKNSAE